MQKSRIIALLAACLTGFAGIAVASGTAGWPVFEKVRLSNLRGAAALSAFPGLAAVFENPASLAFVGRRQVFFSSELGFSGEGDGLGGVLYAEPRGVARYLAGLYYYNAGQAELNWIVNEHLYTRSVALQRDVAGIFSEAVQYNDDVYVGASLKCAFSEIAEERSAVAGALDAGVLCFPNEQLTFSAALLNMGVATSFINKASPLPSTVSAGCSYLMQGRRGYYFLPACNLRYLVPDRELLLDTALRLGSASCGITAGYTVGREESALLFSLDYTRGDIDCAYAYTPGMYLNSTHRFTITYRCAPLGRSNFLRRL